MKSDKPPRHVIVSGRRTGKLWSWERFKQELPKEIQDNMIIVNAPDPVPELRGNKLPRIVDYDMLETSTFTWRLWEELMGKVQMKKYKIRYKEVGRSRIGETTYSGPLSETEVIAFFGLDGDDVEWYEVEEME